MIGAVEDVEEPELDEPPRCLMPARIQRHQPRVAFELVWTHDAARRQKAHHRDHADAEPIERHVDGEVRLVRLDRIFEEHVHDPLLPEDRCVVGERRSVDVRQRFLVGAERSIRLERHPR